MERAELQSDSSERCLALRLRNASVSAWLITTALALVGAPEARAGDGHHIDEAHGYQIEYPQRWRQVPLVRGERWIVAKYVSLDSDRVERVEERGDKEYRHASTMDVLHLPPAGRTPGAGRYDGYVKWLHASMQRREQGFHLLEQVEEKVAGQPASRMEYSLDKGGIGFPRRLVAWVFKKGSHQYVVQFEILEDLYQERIRECKRTVGTFALLEGDAPEPTTTVTRPKAPRTYYMTRVLDQRAWAELSLSARKKHRDAAVIDLWKHERTASPSHWNSATYKNFYFTTEHSLGSVGTFVKSLSAMRSWLDVQFGKVSEEHVPRMVFRLFATRGAQRAYAVRSGDAGNSVLSSFNDDLEGEARMRESYKAILNRWFYAKMGPSGITAPSQLPAWMAQGFEALIWGDAAGKRFTPELDAEKIRKARKQGVLLTARELMTMTRKDFTRKGGDKTKLWQEQSRFLFHYILNEKRNKLLKGFLINYMQRWAAAVQADAFRDYKRAAKEKARLRANEEERKPLEERENEKRRLERQRTAEKREKKHLENLILDCCNWHDHQWAAFERAFAKSL